MIRRTLWLPEKRSGSKHGAKKSAHHSGSHGVPTARGLPRRGPRLRSRCTGSRRQGGVRAAKYLVRAVKVACVQQSTGACGGGGVQFDFHEEVFDY